MSAESAERLAADPACRVLQGAAARVATGIALAWSLFQLWVASPLPFQLNLLLLNDTQTRSLHLAFAMALAFVTCAGVRRGASLASLPWTDRVLAVVGAGCAGYLFLRYAAIAQRPGLPTSLDQAAGVVGMLLLLEAARRTLGLPMVVLALAFLAYMFLGPWMPEVIAHRGASLSKAVSHMWLTTEGVFGVALGVSTSFIFLFVLFGALLERAGAGDYFIRSAMSLLGHLRGGPAKAAVVASAATGMISGSSIANVVTTGTFTIPLMKTVGYAPRKAAAIEVAASVDGQIMPPVMGAAAFLMVEYVGIPYTQVLKHALLPALLSYAALLYLVHLEAMRAGIQGLPRAAGQRRRGWLGGALGLSGTILLAGVVYYGLGWIGPLTTRLSWPGLTAVLGLVYLALLAVSARSTASENPAGPLTVLPAAGPTILSGLHFLLPVVVLVWNLMVEALSPGLSAFWATVTLAVIVVTQRPLLAWLRREPAAARASAWRTGWWDLFHGLVGGARNMTGIAIATAAAGIIVGVVTMTGIGLVLTEFVELLSGGSLVLMLLLVAVICLILGMGLPTTANYIVVSSLMAPVIVELGAQSGLFVPLIAVHLFVFYFGLMADVTPPVGLASYAAAGIARSDPIATGVQAFAYSIRTAVLPFMFIFNTQLLLIGVSSWWGLALTVAGALAASLCFAAATQGWFVCRSRRHESLLLLLIAFSLFRPDFWMDRLYPSHVTQAPSIGLDWVADAPAGGRVRLWLSGTDLTGREIERGVLLPLGDPQPDPVARLARAGVTVTAEDGRLYIAQVRFGSDADRLGLVPGQRIASLDVPADRPAAAWMLLPPALLLLGLGLVQRRRSRRSNDTGETLVAHGARA